MAFTKYTHIERLDTPDCEGLLNNTVYVTAKMDGTNASVWYENGEVKCGSRNRELESGKDNAGFYSWIHSGNPEAFALRRFVALHDELTVFGEWMGCDKFVGSIKDYDQEAMGQMWIFDVYNRELNKYLPEEEWRELLFAYDLDKWFVKLLAKVYYPTAEDIADIAKRNKWMLTNAPHSGEGVVCKVPNWTNQCGHFCYGKLVLDEYKQHKAKPQKKELVPGEVEQNIVENYLTESELGKNIAKTCVFFNEEEFDRKSGKMIGFYLNLCYTDTVLGEMKDICKKFKNPTIDFAKLNSLCNVKARHYIGY